MNRKTSLFALAFAMILLAFAVLAAFVGGNSHRAAICVIGFWICFAVFAWVVPITRRQARKL